MVAILAVVVAADWWRPTKVPSYAYSLVETAHFGGAISALQLEAGGTLRARYGQDEIVLDISRPPHISPVQMPPDAHGLWRTGPAVVGEPTAAPDEFDVVSGSLVITGTSGSWFVADHSNLESARRMGLPRAIRSAVAVVADTDRTVIAQSDGRILVMPPGELREDRALAVWHGVTGADALAFDGKDLYVASQVGESYRSAVARVSLHDGLPQSGFVIDADVWSIAATGGVIAGTGWAGEYMDLGLHAFAVPGSNAGSTLWSPHRCDSSGRIAIALMDEGGTAPVAVVACGSLLMTRPVVESPTAKRAMLGAEAHQLEQSAWNRIELGPGVGVNALVHGGGVVYAAFTRSSSWRSIARPNAVVAVTQGGRRLESELRTPELLRLVSDGTWLYALSNDGRLIVIDGSDPQHLEVVAAQRIKRAIDAVTPLRRSSRASDWGPGSPIVAAANGQLLVAYGSGDRANTRRALVFDVSDPRRPTQITGSTSICASSDAVAVANGTGARFIAACHDRPAAVYEVTTVEDPAYAAQPTLTPTPTPSPVPSPDPFLTPLVIAPILAEKASSSSTSFSRLTAHECLYRLELDFFDLPTHETIVDIPMSVRAIDRAKVPEIEDFSAWQLKSDAARNARADVYPRLAPIDPSLIRESPDAIRLLVSGPAETGDYLVEGVTLEEKAGDWYIMAEVETACGTDTVLYEFSRE